jgi:hypothetical protein
LDFLFGGLNASSVAWASFMCVHRRLNCNFSCFFFRAFHGLFSAPPFIFPRKTSPATPADILKYSPMLKQGDLLSDQVVISGTTYRPGFIVITKVISSDVLEVGEILKTVVRENCVFCLLLLSEAARNHLGFFEALPSDKVTLVEFKNLADYKPLIKRADSVCFPFVLHHHVVTPPFEKGKLLLLTASFFVVILKANDKKCQRKEPILGFTFNNEQSRGNLGKFQRCFYNYHQRVSKPSDPCFLLAA